MEKILNFDALEDINIPEIKTEEVISSKPLEDKSKDEKKDKEFEIEEVESIHVFTNTEEDEEDDSTKKIKTSSDDEPNDPVLEIAKWQSNLGIIDFEEDEYNKAEDKEEFFKQKYNEKVRKTADESLHPVIRELNEKFREGVPLDELITSRSEQMRLETIKDEDLEKDEDMQENLVAEMLRISGWEKDEIKDELETYKDSNKLASKAKRALQKLIENEKSVQKQLELEAKKQTEMQEEQYKENLRKLNETIMKKDTFIEGITMTKEDKEKLYNSIVKRDKDGLNLFERKLVENPDLQFAFAQFVLQLDGKFDKLKNIGKTEQNKKLKNEIDTYSDKKDKKTSLDLAVVREALNKSKRTY